MKRLIARGSLLLAAAALATSGLSIAPAGAVTQPGKCTKLSTKTSGSTVIFTVSKGLFAGKHAKAQLKITTPSAENCTPGHPVKHISLKNTTNHPWLIF